MHSLVSNRVHSNNSDIDYMYMCVGVSWFDK